MRHQPGLVGIDPGPAQGRLGEEDVGPSPHQPVLEQPVREDHAGPGGLAAVADHLAQEAPVMGDDLEIEVVDAPAGIAGAAVVGRQRAPALAEGDEGLGQRAEQDRGGTEEAIGTEREHRIALHLLDLQGRGEPAHDRAQQLGDDRRTVLEVGRRHELREARYVGQDQHAVFGMGVHAHETPEPGVRESRRTGPGW
jgi:hypothetical protein